MTWSVRPPTLRDVPAILNVVHASDLALIGEPEWTVEEIVATLTAPNHDPARDSWLAVELDGTAVAWAYLDNPTRGPRESIEVYAMPGRGESAQRPLLELAIDRAAERARDAGHNEATLSAAAIATERAYIAAIESAGFAFVKRHARLRRPLSGDERPAAGFDVGPPRNGDERPATRFDVGPPGHGDERPATRFDVGPPRHGDERPAAGFDVGPPRHGDERPATRFDVRPLRHGDEPELRRFHLVLAEAFPGHVPAGFPEWFEGIAALPSVSWDEWFVAEVDGAIVGALQSSEQSVANHEGWVKNLAVLPEHRKYGIGGALLAAAFAAYAAKGRKWAGLGVDLSNASGAHRLYASVGMAPVFEADVYERRITAGATRAPYP